MIALADPCVTTLSEPQFLRLVDAASRAPSGDNNQPWGFRRTHAGVDVLHHRERALPSDVHDLFSWLSVGAAIENLLLAGGREGLAADVDYCRRPFPQVNSAEQVAHVRFADDAPPYPDDLAAYIDHRCTNRKPYGPSPPDAAVLARIADAAGRLARPVEWRTDLVHKQQLARLVVAADRVRFESRTFHEEFHSVLRYAPAEAEAARDGLDIRTFEAPAAAAHIFRWLKPWNRMRLANRFGVSRAMAATSRKLIVHSGAIGLLTATGDGDAAFLDAGRALQRVWLAATREQLALQPLGALPLFLHRLSVLGRDAFPDAQRRAVAALQRPFSQLFPADNGVPVLLFRIGRAPAPSARSLRFEPGALITRE